MATAPVLETRGISKTFGGQRALANVSLSVQAREVHALLGENGSGKSTMIKILAGVYTPDRGQILINGEPLAVGSPRLSHLAGLRFVHQTLGIIGDLSAVENIALGFGYRRRARVAIDWPAQRAKTRELLALLHADFDIERPVRDLRPVDRTAVAIARALDQDSGTPRVLVLDEPTAALPGSEVELLLALVRRMRDAGASVIYVSHRLDEVMEIATMASVLRDGVLRGTGSLAEFGRRGLVHLILGTTGENPPAADNIDVRDIPAAVSHESSEANEDARQSATSAVSLKVEALSTRRIAGLSFALRNSEILGFAGLTGSGREELALSLVGATASRVKLTFPGGKVVENPSPRDARRHGLALVLPNRAHGAAAGELSISENIALPSQPSFARAGFVRRGAEESLVGKMIRTLDIRPRDTERAYRLLSGGNQQKVVFAKWLAVNPAVMILDDPTSGVDIGARRTIYSLIQQLAAGGTSFVVCSADLEDLVSVCTRVAILKAGRVTKVVEPPDLSIAQLQHEMLD